MHKMIDAKEEMGAAIPMYKWVFSAILLKIKVRGTLKAKVVISEWAIVNTE